MRTTIELDEKDIAAAIKAYVLAERRMKTTGNVSIDVETDDRSGAHVITASVSAEPYVDPQQ